MNDVNHERAWRAGLEGDRLVFNRLIRPHLDELLHAARRDLRYHQHLGDLSPGDLTPEELVGETLLQVWASRSCRPSAVSLRAWLLGTQHRMLQMLIDRQTRERELWTVSLEDLVPPEPLYDDDESLWEWYQPDDLLRWEDVLPAAAEPEEESETYAMAADERQALLLHDEHKISTMEVAYALGTSVEGTMEMVRKARAHVRVVREANPT